ncbi:hypothetical protein ANO14919_007050 [Xylariales sp. No.14919]|nr:hypothetical protein ANO14919_007050 [Xylariales sp. No.14919]
MATQPGHTGLRCSNANEGQAAHEFDPTDGVQDQDTLKSCTVCDSDANLRCSTCGAWYCNRECFMKDWPLHKALCKTLKDVFHSSKAPINNVRAILFPMASSKPTWAWIDLERLDTSIMQALGIPAEEPLEQLGIQLAANDINKSLTHRKIGHGIRQFTAPNARIEGSNINKSIFALADPGSLKVYFGSAIFFGFRTYETEGTTKVCYEDASTRDLRMVIEWYYTNQDNPFVSKLHRLPIKSYSCPGKEVPLWPAVKINCDGDRARLAVLTRRAEAIHNVQVLSNVVSPVCEFAEMAGLPWVVRSCSSIIDPVTEGNSAGALLHNWFGRIFAQDVVQSFQVWNLTHANGWTVPGHLDSTFCGSILVMHKHGCKIDMAHVVCFIKFIEDVFEHATPLQIAGEKDTDNFRFLTSKLELQRFITREAFESFWWEFITNEEGLAAAFYPSPYNSSYVGETDPVPMTDEEVMKAREEVERLLLEEA